MGTTRAEDLRKEFGTLITSTTVLNKLKWGNDSFNAGMYDGSNQPYIRTDIPGVNVSNPEPTIVNNDAPLPPQTGIDFLIRNGLQAPKAAATDVSRLFKMFTDTKSPNGILFSATQNALSQVSVKTQASFGVGYGNTKRPNFLDGTGGGVSSGLYLPSSTLAQAGVGFLGTHLNLMGLNPATPNSRVPQSNPPSSGGLNTYTSVAEETFANLGNEDGDWSNRLVAIYEDRQRFYSPSQNIISYGGGPGSVLGLGKTNIMFQGQRTGENNWRVGVNWNPEKYTSHEIQDFRVEQPNDLAYGRLGLDESTITSLSPDYKTQNANVRINRGNPGQSQDVFNYATPAETLNAVDMLTSLPVYSAEGVDPLAPTNDFVKFNIQVINNDTPSKSTYIHFRAFIDSFSDAYKAAWNPVKYVGRGEDLYNYSGFGRSVNMSFTCYAQSKAELIPMYSKLNYLASTLAPDYNEAGFMRGNIVKLTIGGYLFEQPGIITSLTYTIPQESTWEIAINNEGLADPTVKELSHMISVTGMSFTPIHTFLPQKVQQPGRNQVERYIALSNDATAGNYNDLPNYKTEIANDFFETNDFNLST
tara:strand:- start:1421 stop:3181 length:1761 start_codon:yes stop_codon:yes gene_type:complete